jgi:hypothetical protein
MILCLMTNHIHENVYPKQEEFEDTKWVIIIGISKKNKQHNDQNKLVKKQIVRHYVKMNMCCRVPMAYVHESSRD